MEDVNDDFGELYADVEFQASSAINGVPDISQLCVRQQQQEEQQPLSNELSNDSSDSLDSADDGSGLGNDERREKDLDRGNDGECEVVVESGSDSDDDDDFDVVVNDDDVGANNGRECRNVGEDDEKEFVAVTTEANSMLKNQDRVYGGGVELSVSGYGGEKGHAGKNCWVSQYRFVRQYGLIPMGNPRVTSSSRGNKEDTDYIQNRRKTLGRGGPSYPGTIPCLPEHTGGGFWLPWNRTIVDVDIDIFEQKPWTLAGADVTDYFNFGFDEESWKSYCQSLDQLRQQTFTQGQRQVEGMRLKLDNATTAVKELANKDVNEAFFHNGGRMAISQESGFPMRQCKQQIGRAIHVEDSTIERQPSMDARPPRSRDADVVIEINVEEPEGSGSGKEEPDEMLETKCTISENGCGMEKLKPETEKMGSYKSCDMAKDSFEKNIQSPSVSTEPRRLYDSGTESSHILQDSGSQGKRHKKSDALHPGKVVALSRGYSRSVEKLNNSMEENDRRSTETNPCVAGIDVLFDDQIQSSPTLSDSDTWSKASNDSDHCDPIRAQDSRRSSADSMWEGHRVGEYDHIFRESGRDDIKTKDIDIKHHSRVRSPIEESWKYHHQKVWKHAEPSRQNDEDNNYNIGIRRQHDRSYFSAHRHRSKARLHASTFGEDSERYREKESFVRCYDKRIVEHKTGCMREFHRWDKWNSRDDMDSCSPRGWDEDILFSGSRFQRTKGKIAESEHYSRDRECMIDREPKFENLPSFALTNTVHIERRNLQRDYDDVRSIRRSRRDLSLEYGHSDGPGLDRYASRHPLNYREAEYLDWDIESDRHSRHVGREMETAGRGDWYLENHGLDSDYPWWIRDGDEDQHWQASRSNLDYLGRHHDYTERRRGSPVCSDDVDDYRSFETHRRHGGYISHRNDHDERRVYSHNGAYDGQDTIRYIDEDDYFVRKHTDFQSRGMSSTEDRQFNGHFDGDFYDEDVLDSFKDVPRHKWHGTKNGFVLGGTHTQVMRHKQGMVRNGGSNACHTSSKMPTRFEHQKIGIRCRNSEELRYVDGESKSMQPRRQSSKTLRDSDNDVCTTVDERVQKQQERKHEVYKSGTKNTKRILWHDKSYVKNQDVTDLEEGQIPTEEPSKEIQKENKSLLKRISNKKATGQTDLNVYDENRILETMARMEKRRERFKEPILPKKETVSDPKPQVDLVVETSECKQQRPLRKRRWGGS